MSRLRNVAQNAEAQLVSGLTFYLFLFYVIDYFIRISSRIPGAGVIRPTLLMAVMITLLLVFQAGKLRDRWQHGSSKALKALLIYVAITLPLVSWPGSVIKNNLPEFVKAIVFFYFTICAVDSPRRLRIFLFVFVTCQVFRVLEPLYLNLTEGYWGSKTWVDGGFVQRLAGGPYDVINGNELGFVIVTVIPFLHYLVFSRGLIGKVIYLSLLPALLYALVLTMSRGAFLALLVVGFFIFIRSKKKMILLVVAISGAIYIWGNLSDVQRDRYLSLTGAEVASAGTAKGRVDGVFREFELALERPIFGHGVGTTPEAKFHKFGFVQASHSLYAELIIEIGLIGFILFVKFLLTAWANLKVLMASSVIRENLTREQRWRVDLTMAMQCIFWMYVFYSSNYWGLSQYYWYLFCALSLVIVTQLGGDRAQPVNPGESREQQQSQGSANRPLARRRHSYLHQVRVQ